jgi:hypothetical protein
VPPQVLSDFWAALPHAAWSDDGKVLTLAKGTNFLGKAKLGSQLYLRACYPSLQREVSELFAQEDSKGKKKNGAVAIIGNPGEKKAHVFVSEKGFGLCSVSSLLSPLLEILRPHPDCTKCSRVCFLAGIGKSIFGYLLLYQWATEDPPPPVVVVKRGFCSRPTLLTKDGCFLLDEKSLADQLSRPEVRYV